MSPENPALFQNNPDRNVRVGKWIWFRYDGTTPTGKTKYFCVMTQGDDAVIGVIKWFGPWRKYIFEPVEETVFEQDCLRDIAGFLDQLMEERANVQIAVKRFEAEGKA